MTQNDRDLIERFGEPAGYAEVMDGRVLSIRTDRSTFCTEPLYTADRLQALSAEVERLKAALKRCGEIVENNLYRQHEKIEDVPLIVAQALKGANNG